MRKFIEIIKNIWKIEDLRNRLLTTLLFVLIYRFGSFVVLPGVDPTALTDLRAQTAGGLMALLDMFSGGAFSNASVFALGIMPYITASIVIQLLTPVLPALEKMKREGESGHQKLNQYTRYLTVIVSVVQGAVVAMTMVNPGNFGLPPASEVLFVGNQKLFVHRLSLSFMV